MENVPAALSKKAACATDEVLADVSPLHLDRQVAWYLGDSQNLCLIIEPEGQWTPKPELIAHTSKLQTDDGD